MADTAFLSPGRPDGLCNLNYGERMIASSLSLNEGQELARIINGMDAALRRLLAGHPHVRAMGAEPGVVYCVLCGARAFHVSDVEHASDCMYSLLR